MPCLRCLYTGLLLVLALISAPLGGAETPEAQTQAIIVQIQELEASGAARDASNEGREPPSTYAFEKQLGRIGAPAVPLLLPLLSDRDHPLAAWAAAAGLVRIGSPAVPALVAALRGPDASLRDEAASVLGRIDPPAVATLPALIAALRDTRTQEYGFRSSVMKALGRLGPAAEAAVPALIEALKDKDCSHDAAKALGQIGPAAKAAIPQLLAGLPIVNHSFVNSNAAEALACMGPEGAVAIPVLIESLAIEPGEFLQDGGHLAADALHHFAPVISRFLPRLIAGLGDDRPWVRRNSACALGRLGPAAGNDAMPAIIATFAKSRLTACDLDYICRETVFPADLIPILVQVLQGGDEYDRAAAARILGRMGPGAQPAIMALIAGLHDQQRIVRNDCATALGLIGAPALTAIPALAGNLTNEEGCLPSYAGRALARIGPAALPQLQRSLGDKDRCSNAAEALGDIGPAARPAVQGLHALLRSDDLGARRDAAVALGKIGPDALPAMPGLLALLHDPEPNVQIDAVDALGRIGPAAENAVPALMALLDATDNRSVRIASIQALQRIGIIRGLPILASLLNSKSYDTIEAFTTFGVTARDYLPILRHAQESAGNEGWDRAIGTTIDAIAASDPADALPAYRRDLAIMERLAGWRPEDARLQAELAVSLNAVAWDLLSDPLPANRDPAEALLLAERAVALSGRKVPDQLAYLGVAYGEHGRWDEALATMNEAIALVQPADQAWYLNARKRLQAHRRLR